MSAAIIYARVSSEDQIERNALNLPTQERKCRKHCEQQGWSVIRVFTDAGESARTADRPQLQELLKFCRDPKHKVAYVVVADLSRLARNVFDQGGIIAILTEHKIRLVSVDEPMLDNSAAGKFSTTVLGALNQFYSDNQSEKIKYRMRAAVEQGRFVNRAPIGYKNVQSDGTKGIVVDRDRAPLIKKAFELVAGGSYTSDAVLRTVTALGLRTPNNLKLPKQSFSKMLKNPIYAGWVCFPSSNLKCRGNHEPIVTEELFNTVQDTLEGKRAPVPKQRQNPAFPLRGFVRCYQCKKPLTAAASRGRSKQYPRYWCWQKGCNAVSVSKETLELQFLRLLAMMQPTAELIARLPEISQANWELRKKRVTDDRRTLQTRLNEQDALNRRAIEARLTGDLSAEDFAAFKAEVTGRISELETQIKALDSELSTMNELLSQAHIEAFNIAETWSKAGVNEKQELQLAVFPDGLLWSPEVAFFEPGNTTLMFAVQELLDDLGKESRAVQVGCGGWI